jgi:hypothetical protein
MQDAGTEASRRVQWYHPGEIVIVARVPRDTAASERKMHTAMHTRLLRHASDHVPRGVSHMRSFVFDAPGQPNSLVFFFQKLTSSDSSVAVKAAVDTLHSRLDGLGGQGVEVIGAMPHWHLRAHEEFSGGSPGSLPRPVYPDQVPQNWTSRFYQPVEPHFDLAHAAQATEPVPVAVLDTRVDLEHAARRGAEFRAQANNHQLLDTVEWLKSSAHTDEGFAQEIDQVSQHHHAPAMGGGSEPHPYRMPDHSLFVAGLIRGIAPQAPLALEPVLDELGVGDLSLLLLGLRRVLTRKQPDQPQIVNLSLGFLPHPARLPAAWYGLPRPHDPLYLHAAELFDPAHDQRWLSANRSEAERTVDLLQIGLRELATYLSLNNCLVIAAAGNDSRPQVEAHQARMEPRLPARFDTVLGVAATTSDPRQPAPYSNVGDERELGDHVATFGGNVSEGLEPQDGVIGIYSGEFPGRRPNETGWAFWSGTSFATAIVSGIAANFWAYRRKQDPSLHAADVLAEIHAEATASGPYVPALRTPAIEVRGRWGR